MSTSKQMAAALRGEEHAPGPSDNQWGHNGSCVKCLRQKVQDLEAERDELNGWIEEHALVKTLARAERAEAALARVEALAADLDAYPNNTWVPLAVRQALNAALAGPSPTDEGGES